MMNSAIFIDRDGTLIEDIPYNANPKLIKLNEGVIEGLKTLQELGFFLIVVSNQSGIAMGYFKRHALKKMMRRIDDMLRFSGVYLDGFLFCPHHPDGKVKKFSIDCDCRKPKPGLLHQAAQNFNIDLANSWMIGDILNDVEAGNRAGCKTILLNDGGETEWLTDDMRKPTHIVRDIKQAANYIVNFYKDDGVCDK